jgi:queuine tRNA-ribosyltransferase
MKYLKQIRVKGKTMRFPAYFPDATRAVIRSLDSQDLMKVGIEGLILNPYHLMSQPGLEPIKKAGGIKNYMGWPGWAIADSGGWQLLSLIYKDKSFGKVDDAGVTFYKGSLGEKKRYVLTPEKSIRLQLELGADIVICLDDCPARDASKKEVAESVGRTIVWAERCKAEFWKRLGRDRISELEIRSQRPLLFAVVQGGFDKGLRSRCAQALVKIGFDGYGWGGWTVISPNRLDLKIGKLIADNLPPDKPKFALGVGYPWDIIDCTKLDYHIFDCVLPTRDARHGRLYVWTKNPDKTNILKTNSRKLFAYFYPDKQKYAVDRKPVDQF